MSIEYKSEEKTFVLSYQELKQKHLEFCEMSDQEFLDSLEDVVHLACIICFLKEIPTYVCLSDTGIIHELVHLFKTDGTTASIEEIRKLFEESLKLH